ncbi:hypothetical protein [Yinghuangia sp. YIM S09857]|uniref:hypothetical protein n=1 Tax=Yinghuangia sp. YIM S09857 TaxID=3436929 RepID=UPI003F535D4E
MGIVSDAPSGQTNFMGFTHEQLLQMFGAASPTHAFEASLKLGTASHMLTQAAEELASGIHNLDWDGDAAERFRVWADQLVVTTHHLANYSGDVGATLLDVAVSIGSTKLPPVPTEDLELVHGFAKNPGAVAAVATISPAEAGTLASDLDRAKANIEYQRIEAVSQMRKLAMGYESAAERMDALAPPVFPQAPNLYGVEHVTWHPIDGPGDGPSGSGDDAAPPVAWGMDGVVSGDTPRKDGAVVVPGSQVTAPVPPITGMQVPGAAPGGFAPPTTDVALAGAATLAHPTAGPPTSPPVTAAGTGGTSGTAPVAPIVGVPSPVSGSPGKASSGTGVSPRPGTGTAGRNSGPPGASAVRPMTTTGATGTFGGKPVSHGVPGRIPGTPTAVGGTTSPRPYGRPGAPGITGGQIVPGSAAPRGGTRTGPVHGGVPAHPATGPRGPVGATGTGSRAVGNRPFSPGGSGIRSATGGRTQVSATDGGPSGRGPTRGFGPAAVPSDERRRRGDSRVEYGDEDEESSAADKPPVPPVVG